MTAEQLADEIRRQIGDRWDVPNGHGVDLKTSLVRPSLIPVIQRFVRNGQIRDQLTEAWLVLVEDSKTDDGYRIVAKPDGSMFGLASHGFPTDKHLVLDGWYGDFMTTFFAM